MDNASTDNTAFIAQHEWGKYNNFQTEFRIVVQTIPGLSFARRKGVEQAKYEYIVFCDDDNWLDENYVISSYRLLNSNEKIGVAGGQSIPISDIQFPQWWNDYKEGYAVGTQGNHSGDITNRNYIWGAGMVTRRKLYLSAFSEIHPSLLTDRNGDSLSSGGDSEYSLRIILMGYILYYDETLNFKHFIPKDRLTISYRDRLFEGFKKSHDVLNEYIYEVNYISLSRIQKLKYLMKSILRLPIYKFFPNKRLSVQLQINNIYRATKFSTSLVSKDVKQIVDFVLSKRKSNKYI